MFGVAVYAHSFVWVLQEISSVEVEKASAMPAGVGKWKDLQ